MTDNLHLVCPHCDTINRVAKSRLNDTPQCGRCGKALFVGHPVALSASNFARHIERNDIPVLVDFWAPWCGPCQMMAPHFEQAAGMLEPHMRLAKVDTESEPNLGAQYHIRSIPTLVLFQHGKEIARQSGAMMGQHLVQWVQGAMRS